MALARQTRVAMEMALENDLLCQEFRSVVGLHVPAVWTVQWVVVHKVSKLEV